MEPHSTKDLSVNDRSIHRLSAVKLSACENMGPGAPNSMEEDMPDALKRRAGSLLFESPDARLAAELAEDIPSTMHKPPPRKQRRWGNSQAGSSSGKSAEAMTGGLIPFVGPSDITGTSGLGNPASSKAVSQSDASSEADHTVKALFPATSEETRLVIPRAAERVIHSTVLPTQERSPLEPRDGAPPVGQLEGVTSDQKDQSGKTHGKHGKGCNPRNCKRVRKPRRTKVNCSTWSSQGVGYSSPKSRGPPRSRTALRLTDTILHPLTEMVISCAPQV
jgi:hypothetical protein